MHMTRVPREGICWAIHKYSKLDKEKWLMSAVIAMYTESWAFLVPTNTRCPGSRAIMLVCYLLLLMLLLLLNYYYHHHLSTYSCQTFAAAGLTVWNSLPDNLRDPNVSYYRQLQALVKNVFCFQRTSAISTLDMLRRCTLQIYLLTINTSLLLICRHYSNASTKPSGALYTKISFSDYVTISTQKTIAIWHTELTTYK